MLEGNVNILFLAASDTIFSSLGWLFRLMAEHKDVQQRVYKELMQVEGTARYDERHKIPYTFAVLMEGQRFSSIVPLSTTRRWARFSLYYSSTLSITYHSIQTSSIPCHFVMPVDDVLDLHHPQEGDSVPFSNLPSYWRGTKLVDLSYTFSGICLGRLPGPQSHFGSRLLWF